MREPATTRQLSYLRALHAKLQDILKDDSLPELPSEVDDVLTKREAMSLIDDMKTAIARLSQRPASVVSPKDDPFGYEQKPEPFPAPAPVHHLTLSEKQDLFFEGRSERPPPSGSGFIKVWQKRRNRLGYHGIKYGWVWQCYHPSHADSRGNIKTVYGQSQNGFQQCLDNAVRHYYSRHSKER